MVSGVILNSVPIQVMVRSGFDVSVVGRRHVGTVDRRASPHEEQSQAVTRHVSCHTSAYLSVEIVRLLEGERDVVSSDVRHTLIASLSRRSGVIGDDPIEPCPSHVPRPETTDNMLSPFLRDIALSR